MSDEIKVGDLVECVAIPDGKRFSTSPVKVGQIGIVLNLKQFIEGDLYINGFPVIGWYLEFSANPGILTHVNFFRPIRDSRAPQAITFETREKEVRT